ncbi:MAG: hypothetical protein AAB588_01195 [Patescibacteria group bacterium]
MNKFTIFTVILVVSVITVMADLAVRQYFGDGNASVVSFDESVTSDSPGEAGLASSAPPAPLDDSPPPAQPSPPVVVLPITTSPSAKLTSELFTATGFTGSPTEKHFEGKLYQLLDISQIPVDGINFFEVSQDASPGATPVAAVTEISLRDEIRALQLYVLLQNKTKPYIDLSLNETNAYGDRSFYINHAKKPDEAFLTVKIGKTIYGFAYVKTYHAQIKKFIQLLTL